MALRNSALKVSVHSDDVFVNKSAKIVGDPPGNCKQKFRDSRKLLAGESQFARDWGLAAQSTTAKKIAALAGDQRIRAIDKPPPSPPR